MIKTKEQLTAEKPSLRAKYIKRQLARAVVIVNERLETAVSKNHKCITIQLDQNDIEVFKLVKAAILEAGYDMNTTDGTDTYVIKVP